MLGLGVLGSLGRRAEDHPHRVGAGFQLCAHEVGHGAAYAREGGKWKWHGGLPLTANSDRKGWRGIRRLVVNEGSAPRDGPRPPAGDDDFEGADGDPGAGGFRGRRGGPASRLGPGRGGPEGRRVGIDAPGRGCLGTPGDRSRDRRGDGRAGEPATVAGIAVPMRVEPPRLPHRQPEGNAAGSAGALLPIVILREPRRPQDLGSAGSDGGSQYSRPWRRWRCPLGLKPQAQGVPPCGRGPSYLESAPVREGGSPAGRDALSLGFQPQGRPRHAGRNAHAVLGAHAARDTRLAGTPTPYGAPTPARTSMPSAPWVPPPGREAVGTGGRLGGGRRRRAQRRILRVCGRSQRPPPGLPPAPTLPLPGGRDPPPAPRGHSAIEGTRVGASPGGRDALSLGFQPQGRAVGLVGSANRSDPSNPSRRFGPSEPFPLPSILRVVSLPIRMTSGEGPGRSGLPSIASFPASPGRGGRAVGEGPGVRDPSKLGRGEVVVL